MDESKKLDANSALMELDKGLRSLKVGQQCKAIVCFPQLFERFPFPILINSAFLKLGDVFRIGNNFLRLCILKVAQQSEMHLDKIFSIEELKERIYTVVHSNDPYARAITLRMLGSLACILCADKSVHHSILQGLDSNDQVEQEAAIFATVQFASHSKAFAKGICNKIAAMLEGLSAPLEIKLKLVPVLQHMHYDIQIFTKARNVLKELLPTYPAQEFVLVTLHTLTNLSLHSVVDIPAQVSLLLQYVRCDPREAIKILALQDLNVLAYRTPHLWNTTDCDGLCKTYGAPGIQSSVKSHILSILCTLSNTPAILQQNIGEDSELMGLCSRCACDSDVRQSVFGTRLMCLLVVHISNSNTGSTKYQHTLQQQAASYLENLLLLLVSGGCSTEEDKRLLRILLPAVSEICVVCHKEVCNRLVHSLVGLLTTDCDPCDDVSYMVCETLASVLMKAGDKVSASQIGSDIYELLEEVCSMDAESNHVQKLIVLLCTLLMLLNTSVRDSELTQRMLQLLTGSSRTNTWSWYRVARQASRFGEHSLACKLYSMLSDKVATERHYFWFNSLTEFSTAESTLLRSFDHESTDLVQNMVTASQKYQNGITSLKCSVSPDHPLHFQCAFAQLRCDSILAHLSLFQTSNRLKTHPPPVHNNQPINTLERNNDLSDWLSKCRDDFANIAGKYNTLHLMSFDADDTTIANVDILQQSCLVMSRMIDIVINRGNHNEAMLPSNTDSKSQNTHNKSTTHFIKDLRQSFNSIFKVVEETFQKNISSQCINETHINALLSSSREILKIPLSLPRYFFQSLQTTTIKLAISPSMRSTNDPVLVNRDQRLTLKVEGVIRHDGSAEFKRSNAVHRSVSKIHRDVHKVKVCVNTSAHSQTVNNEKIQETNISMENEVIPHNNYFSTQFLIHLPVTGNHTVTIDASVIDNTGMCWKFGARETLLVKSCDEAARHPRPGGHNRH